MPQTLLAPPRQDLTAERVTDALDLGRSVKVRHGVDILDPLGRVQPAPKILAGAVIWSYRPPDRVAGATTDVASARRTASLTLQGLPSPQASLFRYRIWTEWLARDGSYVRFWLGVFLAALPTVVDDGRTVSYQLKLVDLTYRFSQRLLADPVVVPAGSNNVAWVVQSLEDEFGITETAIGASTSTVVDDIVVDADGTNSWLTVYDKALNGAGYDDLTANEQGVPAATPQAEIAGRGPWITYGPAEIVGRIMRAGQTDPLLQSLVNEVRFMARSGPSLAEEGNGVKTVQNQSTGPASIDGRGGEVVSITVQEDAEDQDTLEAIAAADAQRYFAGGGLRFTGKVALNPRFSDRDVVELVKPTLGLSGVWLCTSWSYPLGPISGPDDVLMAITCEQRVGVS